MVLNPRILRNRHKLEATMQNAQAWLRLRREVSGEAGLDPVELHRTDLPSMLHGSLCCAIDTIANSVED